MLACRRRLQAGPHPIGWQLGLPPSTVHAILHRHGRSRLHVQLAEPVVRYQRERPGELLHIDVKRLGRIGRRRDPSGRLHGLKGRAGWDYLFVCVDDTSRLAHAHLYPAETTANALHFLDHCQALYHRHGLQLAEVLTDNGKCFQRTWQRELAARGLTARHTRVRRPQTNGKAERFIRTLLEEWARNRDYPTNNDRAHALTCYLDYYNTRRRHRALNGHTPTERASVNNLPGTNTWFRACGPATRFGS